MEKPVIHNEFCNITYAINNLHDAKTSRQRAKLVRKHSKSIRFDAKLIRPRAKSSFRNAKLD